MIAKATIEAQLKRLGVKVKSWGASEVAELQHILTPQEEITGYAHGWYDNGFATLVATNERLLLVDKKLFHLTIEDVRYDMIAEVDFHAHLVDATIRVSSMNKTLRFTSMKHNYLRALTNYVQQRVMEVRQQQTFSWQQFEQTPQPALESHEEPAVTSQLTPQIAGINLPLRPAINPYTKSALTTKHQFLPKVPRRFRPE